MPEVLAIVCADVHLSHNPPSARSAEPDWYEAQGRYLDQVGELAEKHGATVYVAGDLFDRWGSPPQLINWAIRNLGGWKPVCIPGQHDLPHHSLEDVRKSAYWTLVEAGAIEHLDSGNQDGSLVVWPTQWGEEIARPSDGSGWITVGITHRYVWCENKGHEGAPIEAHTHKLGRRLDGYNVVVFGDNHIPFQREVGGCLVYNCGCLIPRTVKERDTKPSIGLIHEDGTVERHYLDCSKDRWVDRPEEEALRSEEQEGRIKRFLDDLKVLGDSSLDFRVAVMRYMERNELDDGTRGVLREVLDGP